MAIIIILLTMLLPERCNTLVVSDYCTAKRRMYRRDGLWLALDSFEFARIMQTTEQLVWSQAPRWRNNAICYLIVTSVSTRSQQNCMFWATIIASEAQSGMQGCGQFYIAKDLRFFEFMISRWCDNLSEAIRECRLCNINWFISTQVTV